MPISTRRTFVRGVGLGAFGALLGPLCDRWVREARGAALPAPRRFVLISDKHGLTPMRYQPADRDLTRGTLPAIFQPLEPYRSKMVIADKFYNPFNVGVHGNYEAILTMEAGPRSGLDGTGDQRTTTGYGGISIDRFIAQHLSGGRPVDSISLGTDSVPSADGRDRSFPSITSPVKAYEKAFGAFIPAAPGAADAGRNLIARRRSLLDHVAKDVARLGTRLAGHERAKLDQYTDSIRSMEGKLAKLSDARLTCAVPAAPAAKLHTLQTYRGPLMNEVVDAYVAVATNALSCGVTNVVSLGIVPERALYAFLGDTKDKHDQSHEEQSYKGAAAREILVNMDRWLAQHVRGILDTLAGTAEGGGTMLDGSLVLWVNRNGGKHHNGTQDHAVVLVGDLGGKLKTGRHVSFAPKTRSLADVYLTAARALGIDAATFGAKEHNRGPLAELLA